VDRPVTEYNDLMS